MLNIYRLFQRYSFIVYLVTMLFYLFKLSSRFFFDSVELSEYLLGIMAIIFLILSLPQLKGFMRVLIYFMLISGTVMFFSSNGSIPAYILVMQDMMNALIVFMVLEIIGLPIAVRDLRPLFRPILKNTKKPSVLFGHISIVTMFLGGIINMAAIPLIYYSIWESLTERGLGFARTLGVSLKRGMAFSLFWSPFGIMMALIVEYSGVPWTMIAPTTLLLSMFALAVSFFSEYVLSRDKTSDTKEISVAQDTTCKTVFLKNFWNLTIYVFLLILSIVVLNTYASFGMIDALIIVSVVVPLTWSYFTGIFPLFFDKAINYFCNKVPRFGEPFTLFIAAGAFAAGLKTFGFNTILNAYLQLSFEVLGLIGIMVIIISAMMFLSWVGIHPLVTIVLIGQNLDFHGSHMPPQYIAIAMILGGSLCNLTSPISAVTLVTAGLIEKSPIDVGITWNLLFVVIFIMTLPFILFLSMYLF